MDINYTITERIKCMKKRILAAILTLSMVVSMTACGNSDAGGSKDSAKNNGNGDEPYTVTMVLNGSTQPDEERIAARILFFIHFLLSVTV